jgi:hypothetical protein
MKMNRKHLKNKRVFIDIEYKSIFDLEKIIDQIKNEIGSGIESKEAIISRSGRDFKYEFKQWYDCPIRDYEEKSDGEKIIFVVKSLI